MRAAESVLEKVSGLVFPSGARNLSLWDFARIWIEERFFAPLRMTALSIFPEPLKVAP